MPSIPQEPSIEDVTRRTRLYINDLVTGSDGVPGSGRVLPDSSPYILPLLNEATAQLSRDLRNLGWKDLTQEVVILAIPVIFGANGQGNPDPAAQQNLNFDGFFNGSQQIQSPILPPNLITPLRMWQRSTGTNNPFTGFKQNTTGLISGTQWNYLGEWEWRGKAIWWNGSVQQNDVRLRFNGVVPIYTPDNAPASDFSNIRLPFIEDAQVLASWMAATFSRGRPLVDPAPLFELYTQAKDGMASEIVRAKQGAPVSRESYDSGEQGNQTWE